MNDLGMTTSDAANPFRGAEATTSDLVECLGVTKAYIGKLAADGKLAKLGPNRWDAFEVVRQFTGLLRNRRVNQHDGGGEMPEEVSIKYERERARKMEADAQIAEVLAGLVTGRVLEARAVEEVWIPQQMAARTKLLGLPSKIAAEMPPELAAKVLSLATDLVHEALEQLADFDEQKIAERTDRKRILDPAPTADDAVMEAAAEADAEPMG